MRTLLMLAPLAMLALATTPAKADEFVYQLTQDNCSGNCGPQTSFGTVDVKMIATGEVQVTVTLLNGNKFVNTGLDGFGFNLVSPFNTITLTNFSTGFGGTSPQNSGSNHNDGFGNFNYVVECTGCGNGGSNPEPGPLVFDVSATGLTAASFAQTSSGGGTAAYFFADILSGTTGKTGAVGAVTPGTPVTSTPEPTSIALLGGIVVGIGAIIRQKATRLA